MCFWIVARRFGIQNLLSEKDEIVTCSSLNYILSSPKKSRTLKLVTMSLPIGKRKRKKKLVPFFVSTLNRKQFFDIFRANPNMCLSNVCLSAIWVHTRSTRPAVVLTSANLPFGAAVHHLCPMARSSLRYWQCFLFILFPQEKIKICRVMDNTLHFFLLDDAGEFEWRETRLDSQNERSYPRVLPQQRFANFSERQSPRVSTQKPNESG